MANLITGFRGRRGPSPTGENVVLKNPKWGLCVYCDLEHEREVRLLRLLQSPIIGGGVKCPGCGRRWDSPEEYNAAAKALVERIADDAPWLLDRPTREEVAEEEAWQKEMDESIRKHKASLPSDWSPHFNPDDAPVVMGINGRKDADDTSGTTPEVEGGSGD
jgi:hypothetical protein